MLSTIYVKFLSVLGEIKVFKYPIFLVYDPDEYVINGTDWEEINRVIQRGDIVLRTYKHYLIDDIIPGFYSHAGLYIGDNQVIHAVGEGISVISLYDFCKCDAMAVIRTSATEEQIDKAIEYAKEQLGKGYDYWIDFDSEEHYSCTELVYWCYKGVIDVAPVVISKMFGLLKREVIMPDQFLYDGTCKVIWESQGLKR